MTLYEVFWFERIGQISHVSMRGSRLLPFNLLRATHKLRTPLSLPIHCIVVRSINVYQWWLWWWWCQQQWWLCWWNTRSQHEQKPVTDEYQVKEKSERPSKSWYATQRFSRHMSVFKRRRHLSIGGLHLKPVSSTCLRTFRTKAVVWRYFQILSFIRILGAELSKIW